MQDTLVSCLFSCAGAHFFLAVDQLTNKHLLLAHAILQLPHAISESKNKLDYVAFYPSMVYSL